MIAIRDNETGEWRDGCGCLGCGLPSAIVGVALGVMAAWFFG